MPASIISPPRNLRVGDTCWLLRDTLLYEVSVSEVRLCLEGEPHEFRMYRIKSDYDVYDYLSNTSYHRSDLYLRPTERKLLTEEIKKSHSKFGIPRKRS